MLLYFAAQYGISLLHSNCAVMNMQIPCMASSDCRSVFATRARSDVRAPLKMLPVATWQHTHKVNIYDKAHKQK